MILSEINIYPIKSTRGIPISASKLEPRGLQHDRRWMVVDEHGMFLTQRKLPRMALISVEVASSSLLVSAPDMSPLSIPFSTREGKPLHVQVWNDGVNAQSVNEESDDWFSRFLGFTCKLAFMPEEAVRPVDPKYSVNNSHVSFADAFPLLLISQASLDDLNDRLEQPVPMNRFRPNLVIEGSGAYEEDRWKTIKIGDITFHAAKSCSRCTVPTVDQATGVRGQEPILTLASYRTNNGKVYFGQNLIHANLGTLKVGDAVEIIGWKKKIPQRALRKSRQKEIF